MRAVTVSSPESVHQLITGPEGDPFLHEISTYAWGDDSGRVTDLFRKGPLRVKQPAP